MKNKLNIGSRILLVVAAIGLVVVLYLPIWRIELNAPQYPEGLSLTIHAKGLQGNIDIINGLNHYIGMKTLHNEDFIEFTILPYCFVFFAIAFTLVTIMNRRKWLNLLFALFITFGIIAFVDFWRWEYNYGHNLNPNAAIIVPGMAYQPPLIGFKQLLNFGAYSIPDSGGWIFIGAGILLLTCVIIEWKRYRVVKKRSTFVNPVLVFAVCFSLSSCQAGPEAIKIGKDNCDFCKMTISDARYGAEVLTKKGKVYKFDDMHCVMAFLRSKKLDDAEVKDIYLVDFADGHSLVKAAKSYLLQGEEIHGPMNGNVIAFKNKDSMTEKAARFKAVAIGWEQLNK